MTLDVEEQYRELESRTVFLILNYLTYDLTLQLVDAINADARYANVTILVVDNCSPNESGEVLSSWAH